MTHWFHLNIYVSLYISLFLKIKEFYFSFNKIYHQFREQRIVQKDKTMLQCAVSHLWFCFSCRSLSVHFQDVLFSWCAMPTDKFMLFFIPIVLFLTCVIIWQTGDQSPKISSNIACLVNLCHLIPRYCHSFLCIPIVYIILQSTYPFTSPVIMWSLKDWNDNELHLYFSWLGMATEIHTEIQIAYCFGHSVHSLILLFLCSQKFMHIWIICRLFRTWILQHERTLYHEGLNRKSTGNTLRITSGIH